MHWFVHRWVSVLLEGSTNEENRPSRSGDGACQGIAEALTYQLGAPTDADLDLGGLLRCAFVSSSSAASVVASEAAVTRTAASLFDYACSIGTLTASCCAFGM